MEGHTTERDTRLERRNAMIKNGVSPYPARVQRTHTNLAVLEQFSELKKNDALITVVGRVRSRRLHGGSCFLHIEDGTSSLQVYLKKDIIGDASFSFFTDLIDIADFVEVTGKVFETKRGEKSVLAERARCISKSLLPLPEKWHGLSDVEIRYRKRHLDLIVNAQVRSIFKKRSALYTSLRKFLESEGFLEVETPVLQSIPGGALARPFQTHHHALDTDLFLRVAPELYLKRLIVGGFERVYEISRCFRNEGIDHSHNPEFTQVELYAAYMDYQKLMELTERLVHTLAEDIQHSSVIPYEGKEIDMTPPFVRMTFVDAMKQFGKIDITNMNEHALYGALKERGVKIDSSASRAKMLDDGLKELIRPQLIRPTFLIDYPIELSPLAKKTEYSEKFTERFQLFIAGKEIGNAFSELNDPVDQYERFAQQQKSREQGDDETHQMDLDFIEALEQGMPPTAGLGIGLDRLANLLTDTHSIKEVILFPTLKPVPPEKPS
ncbi:MAG: lysine--tRNA ligase [Patescibacteria group bacterium]|jgi:lysyl-tRNA synthetase class 2